MSLTLTDAALLRASLLKAVDSAPGCCYAARTPGREAVSLVFEPAV